MSPKLLEIKKRTEKNASLRSDDFGHDTHALLLAESDALQVAAADISYLLALVERQEQAIEMLKGHVFSEYPAPKYQSVLDEVLKILNEGEK